MTRTKDALTCAVCLKPGPALDLDHIINRGMGGSEARDVPENKISLCRECHELKTLGRIKTWLKPGENGTYIYFWKRADADVAIRTLVKVDTRYGCLVPNSEAEATDVSGPKVQHASASELAGEGPLSTMRAHDAGDDPLNGPRSPGQGPAEAVARPMVRKRQPSPVSTGADEQSLSAGTDSSSSAPVGGEGGESQSQESPPTDLLVPRRIAAPGPSPSPLSLDSDWADVSDETLQQLYEEGEHRQREGYLLKCKAIWTFRERHVQAWGESWTEQAIERFGCSRRYAHSYANLWQIYATSDTYLREGMAALTDSRSLMQTIGRATVEEGARLLESAVAHVAEYAQPPSVKALMGAEPPERERHACPLCNFEHWIVVDSEWKA